MNHINNKEVQTFELTDKNNLENFTKEEHALYKKNKRELGNLFDNVKKSFLKISLQLYPIYTKKLYRIDNYPDIYQFAEDNFKISKGSCSEFLNISKKFFEKSEDGELLGLADCYKDYNLSQLRILQSVNPEYYGKFRPSMSVREMKETKKRLISPLLNKNDIAEKEHVSGEVELTTPDFFDRSFDSCNEFFNMRDDFLRAFDDIKAKKPHAKFRIVVEGIEV